jgi:proline iminopeptidase
MRSCQPINAAVPLVLALALWRLPAAPLAGPGDVRAAESVAHARGVVGHWAVTEDRLRIWYETEGTGVPILLIPGGPGSSHHPFHLTHRRLARHGRLVYVDNRGRGRSNVGRGSEPYSLANDVRDIEAVRKSLRAERIVVYGRSYGGMVAQAYAIAHPERVQALIVSNSLDGAASWQEYNIDGVKRFYQTLWPDRWDEIVRLRARGFTTSQDTLARLFTNLRELYNYSPANDSLFRLESRAFQESDVSGHNPDVYVGMLGTDPEWTVGGTLAGIEMADQLRIVTAPALVLGGRYDRITPPAVQRKIARALPQARLEIFERSGHRPEFEEAERWQAVMDAFLESVLAPPARGREAGGSR